MRDSAQHSQLGTRYSLGTRGSGLAPRTAHCYTNQFDYHFYSALSGVFQENHVEAG